MSDDQGSLRAGTADRDRTATILGEAKAQGRLSPSEYDERMSKCYAAVTLGDLAALTSDLPVTSPQPPPAPPGAAPAQPGGRGSTTPLKAAWISWLGVGLMMVLIWALSGMGYFWPIWVIGPWGIAMLIWTFTGTNPRDNSNR